MNNASRWLGSLLLLAFILLAACSSALDTPKDLSCPASQTGACNLECSGDDTCQAKCNSANGNCTLTCSGESNCTCSGNTCNLVCNTTGSCTCNAGVCSCQGTNCKK